jgi:hypothetical protein
MAHVAGDLHLPESQQYQEQELANVLAACQMVADEAAAGADLRLTAGRIKLFNKMVLAGLPREDDIVPGEIRTGEITVGDVYRGAPGSDCEYLLGQLCGWLEQILEDAKTGGPHLEPAMGVIRAILAHLYLAWIHPFGDGNGRTARLIEFQLLLAAGFPTPACHLLSNHYMLTRDRYYQVLTETSRADGYPVWRFVSYALQGFTEQLGETIGTIQQFQLGQSWIALIGETPIGQGGPTVHRRQQLLLALPPPGPGGFTPVAGLSQLTPQLAALYATKTSKTLTRDVNKLEEAELIVREGNVIRANYEKLFAFLPVSLDLRAARQASRETDLQLADSSTPLPAAGVSA